MIETRDSVALTVDGRALFEAILAIGSVRDLRAVLQRIVESACGLTGARHGRLEIVGESVGLVDPVEHGVPDGSDPASGALRAGRVLGVPVRVRDEAFGILHLSDRSDGADFTARDRALVDALVRAADAVIDHARAYTVSERRRAWLEASGRILETLHRAEADPAEWRALVGVVHEVSGADLAAIVGDADEDHYVWAPDWDRGWPPAAQLVDGILDEAVAVARGEEWREVALDGTQMLLVPIALELSPPACLVLAFRARRRPRDPEETASLLGFVEQVKLARDHATARADREQLMLLGDRERIARDLHDIVIQRLFAAGLELQVVRRDGVAGAARDRIDAVVGSLDATIRDIRGTIFELREQRSGSVRESVRQLVREYVPLLGSTPRVRASGPIDTLVDDAMADHLLATLREAMANVVRHAAARSVTVHLAVDREQLTLRVVDDGIGVPSTRERESGVRNMRRRAQALGGRCDLRPGLSGGSVLTWSVPVR